MTVMHRAKIIDGRAMAADVKRRTAQRVAELRSQGRSVRLDAIILIRDFTMVLILGVVIGTYSSIFVASPALLEIQAHFGDSSQSADRKKRRRSAQSASAA